MRSEYLQQKSQIIFLIFHHYLILFFANHLMDVALGGEKMMGQRVSVVGI